MNKNKLYFILILILTFILTSCSNTEEPNIIIPPFANISLSYIKITPPTKVKYFVGDSFDSTGFNVTAFYTDSSSKDVTEQAIISGFDSSTKFSTQTITVSYTEANITKTSSFDISISKSYTIYFHSNNDNEIQNSQIIELSDNEVLRENSFTYGNHYFLKWNTKSDGTGSSYKDSSLTNELPITDETTSIDLYAIWVSNNPIVITSSNYQTVLQSLQNITNHEYLLYCTDELTQEIFNEIKSTLYNLYETKISLDFSSITTKISIDFSDRNYDSLVAINMPKINNRQNYWFRFCNNLNYKCKNLKKVQLDNKTTSIGSCAFCKCEALEIINIPETLTSIGDRAFCETNIVELIIPDSVTSIGNSAFKDCYKLKKITLGKGITSINEYVFSWCISLESINIPENVTTICDRAFFDCVKLKSITIPDSVTQIGYSAFESCTELEIVTMGKNLNFINPCAFQGCTNLVTVNLSESLSTIAGSCFSGCTKLKNISLPDRLTELGSSVFYECTALQEIVIPKNIKRLDWYTFKNCTNLTKVTFKSGITYICPQAFIGCTNLTLAIFEVPANWFLEDTATTPHTAFIPSADFSNTLLIASYLRNTYSNYGWTKQENN